MEKFIRFVNDLYWNTRDYHKKTPDEDQFASENPFQRFLNVQPLYAPKLGDYLPRNYKGFFDPIAHKMDLIVQKTKNEVLAKNPTITPRMLLQEIFVNLNEYLAPKEPQEPIYKKMPGMAHHMDQPRQ
eukprot:2332609-Rhodomonas_salina.1